MCLCKNVKRKGDLGRERETMLNGGIEKMMMGGEGRWSIKRERERTGIELNGKERDDAKWGRNRDG